MSINLAPWYVVEIFFRIFFFKKKGSASWLGQVSPQKKKTSHGLACF